MLSREKKHLFLMGAEKDVNNFLFALLHYWSYPGHFNLWGEMILLFSFMRYTFIVQWLRNYRPNMFKGRGSENEDAKMKR